MGKPSRFVPSGFRRRFNTQNPFDQSPFNVTFDKSVPIPPPPVTFRKTRTDDIRITRIGDFRTIRT